MAFGIEKSITVNVVAPFQANVSVYFKEILSATTLFLYDTYNYEGYSLKVKADAYKYLYILNYDYEVEKTVTLTTKIASGLSVLPCTQCLNTPSYVDLDSKFCYNFTTKESACCKKNSANSCSLNKLCSDKFANTISKYTLCQPDSYQYPA